MTQEATTATLEKSAGWDAHELNVATDYWYFYGEGTTGTGLTAAPTNYYGLDDFQADVVFGGWTIYRIEFAWGWHTGAIEFKDVWVADIKINGTVIPLRPDDAGTGRIGRRFYTGNTALSTALSPKTPFRLLGAQLHLNAAATQQTFTITCDAGRVANLYDTKLYSKALAGVQDIVLTFGEGYDFKVEDEIDCAWTNTDTKTFGLTLTYQTVF